MIEVEIDSGDVQKVVKRMTRFDRNARKGVQREVKHSAFRIQARARRLLRVQGAIFTGRLRSSINIRYTRDGLGAVIGTNVNYAGAVEFGREPGSWPPVGAMIEFVRKKIVARPKKLVNQIAYLIGRKIFREGTEARPYLFPAGKQEWPRFKRNIYKVLKMS